MVQKSLHVAFSQQCLPAPLPQVDWHHLQRSHKEAWLELAKAAFASLDTDRDGVLRIDELVARLSQNLSEYEVCVYVGSVGLVWSVFVGLV